MNTLPTELKLHILRHVADHGQSFHSLILSCKSFYAVYTTYSQTLDNALVTSTVNGWLLPLAHLIAIEGVPNWELHRKLVQEEPAIDVAQLPADEKRGAYRTHTIVRAIARNLQSLLTPETWKDKRFTEDVATRFFQSNRAFTGVYAILMGYADGYPSDDDSDDAEGWDYHFKRMGRRFRDAEGRLDGPSVFIILDSYISNVGRMDRSNILKSDLLKKWETPPDFAWYAAGLGSFANKLEGLYAFKAASAAEGVLSENQLEHLEKSALQLQSAFERCDLEPPSTVDGRANAIVEMLYHPATADPSFVCLIRGG